MTSLSMNSLRQLQQYCSLSKGCNHALEDLTQRLKDASLNDPIESVSIVDIRETIWSELCNERQLLLVDLIKYSVDLRTLCLPVCSYCDCLKFQIDILRDIKGSRQLKHLKLRGINPQSVYSNDHSEGLSFARHFPIGETANLISIDILEVQDVGKLLDNYILYEGCPIDLSTIKELHIVGIRDLYSSENLTIVSRLACKTLKSLIWEFGMEDYPGWDAAMSFMANQVPKLSNPPPEEIRIRRLTLKLSEFTIFGKFRIVHAFPVLQSQLGISADRIEELNLVYSTRYLEYESSGALLADTILNEDNTLVTPDSIIIQVSSSVVLLNDDHIKLTRVLKQANKEFEVLSNRYRFPSLKRINLLIGHDEDPEIESLRVPDSDYAIPSQDWTPSSNWKLASEHAPFMHQTGSLYLRTTSKRETNLKAWVEKFSLSAV